MILGGYPIKCNQTMITFCSSYKQTTDCQDPFCTILTPFVLSTGVSTSITSYVYVVVAKSLAVLGIVIVISKIGMKLDLQKKKRNKTRLTI